MKLGAKQLRTTVPEAGDIKKIKKNPIFIILDNVWDTYNIGSIFRLADAVAAEKVFLCGETETPPNSRIKKASVNTWQWVDWEYSETAVSAIEKCKLTPIKSGLKIENLKVVAVEQSPKSTPYDRADYGFPVALVVGNETSGVSKKVLDICDTIVELPMFGVNISLNVMVSLGIVLYEVIRQNH
ncbi:MAG: hypothetical protein A2857_04440 [Candidatus Levybacteria bacterium RIFCSPHIGHO2_01_FULL_36_15]|nr:MAG: hypothetical protein A2857_04440 [Candidatus Levybacteria bacterium RIFCSPHIGHO2_01_FULL_36_15]OGH38606.1 MAG: hypothetical protein A2905_03195 [Candidatus Levybacteria bacterium RIFCSPLOWO2_01_FULL_36_10]